MRALAKLQQVLPSRLRHRVSAFQSSALPMPSPDPRVDPDVLTVIASACRDHERLRFDYQAHSGAASRRSVEPLRKAAIEDGARLVELGVAPLVVVRPGRDQPDNAAGVLHGGAGLRVGKNAGVRTMRERSAAWWVITASQGVPTGQRPGGMPAAMRLVTSSACACSPAMPVVLSPFRDRSGSRSRW